MASACINNIGMSPESFLDCPPAKFPSYGWLSPRMSISREFPDEDGSKAAGGKANASENAVAVKDEHTEADLEASGKDFVDFEFRLEDPVTMLPADELFSDGKLMPLYLSMIRPVTTSDNAASDVRSPDIHKLRRRNEISTSDQYLFSPKAPRCSSRWREILGLKKLYQNSNKQDQQKTTSSSNYSGGAHKSLKHFLHRNSKSSLSSSLDSSLSLPLLKDADSESSISISSSRLSLSSSSSGHEHDDLPRLSLDTNQNSHGTNPPRVRVVKPRTLSPENPTAIRVERSPMRRPQPETTVRGVSVDSPRMNSCGKIVFHSLERSSSSPSSFNGGPRHKHRGMERSYSANVRVTPVLNVPVCSANVRVFGFPLFSSSSQQKREGGGGSCGGITSGGNGAGNKGGHNNNSKNRTDRT